MLSFALLLSNFAINRQYLYFPSVNFSEFFLPFISLQRSNISKFKGNL